MKKKVSFFMPTLETGGAERNVVNLVNNINKDKYGVSLVLGRARGEFMDAVDKKIPIFDMKADYSIKLLFKLMGYFIKEEPDIFVSAFTRINIIAVAAKLFSRSRVKIVATEHVVFSFLPVIGKTKIRRLFAKFILPHLARIVLSKADVIVCVSKGVYRDILNYIHDKKVKVKVIYNPVIREEIHKLADELITDKWFIDNKFPIVTAVGRLVECKDYPTLFGAIDLCLKEKKVKLIVLGSGPEEHKLKKIVRDKNLEENIIFLGFQKNPFKYMKRADVFVLSSLQEGFGNVIVEAMACGTPVVAANCPSGPGEIIQNGINGLLVPPQNKRAMAEAILMILKNPELAKKMSDEGMLRSKDFTVEKSVKEYENIFSELTI